VPSRMRVDRQEAGANQEWPGCGSIACRSLIVWALLCLHPERVHVRRLMVARQQRGNLKDACITQRPGRHTEDGRNIRRWEYNARHASGVGNTCDQKKWSSA
jgi:hypothetical protein